MIIQILLLSTCYFFTGWFGLALPFVGTHITLIWLPAGIAVAALVRWGRSVWPGIYIGAFLVNLFTGSSWPLAASIAVGNTLAPMVSLLILNRFNLHPDFDRQVDVGLIVLGACLGTMVSALGGVASLYLAGEIAVENIPFAMLSWWLGDSIGVLLAAPFLITLTWDNLQYLNRKPIEVVAWTIIASLIAWLTLVHAYGEKDHILPMPFLTIPALTWSGLRFGNTGAALAGLGFSLIAAWSTAFGQGVFILSDLRAGLFLLWAYMATTVLTGLIITALQAERLKIEKDLRITTASFNEAQRIAHIGSWRLDLVTGRLIWSDEIFRLFELDPSQFAATYDAFLNAIHPEDRDSVDHAYHESLVNQHPYQITHRLLMSDGRIKWVHERCVTDFDDKGNPLRSMGTVQDITERKRLEDELQHQAHIDFLTGFSNRRHFMEQAHLELNRAIRYDSPLSIFMIDVDFFKKINDSHGHTVGDSVLRKFAEVCRETLREIDIIGRIGGEEFCILLPKTEKTEAIEAGERLRKAVAHAEVILESGLLLQFTISLGVASLATKNDGFDLLLNLADKALYEAKKTGRNKVCAG